MSQNDDDHLVVPAPPPSLVPPPETSPPPPLTSPRRTISSSSIPAPRSSRSMIPLPAVEPILDQAAQLRVRGDFDGSLETYKKALILAGNTNHEAQASIYASIAEVKLAQGKAREAETNFEKALGVRPKHLRSIDGLIAIAKSAKEWDRVVTFRKKRVDAMDDPEEKAAELCRIADVIEAELKDPKGAAETLETALFHRDGDLGVLLKLKNLYTDLRAWTKLL